MPAYSDILGPKSKNRLPHLGFDLIGLRGRWEVRLQTESLGFDVYLLLTLSTLLHRHLSFIPSCPGACHPPTSGT